MTDIELLAQKLEAYIEKNDEYHRLEDERRRKYEEKIDEIHQILTATGMVGKAFRWILATIIAIGATIITVKQLLGTN
jgi:uncharacterized protein (UPF0335 family)